MEDLAYILFFAASLGAAFTAGYVKGGLDALKAIEKDINELIDQK